MRPRFFVDSDVALGDGVDVSQRHPVVELSPVDSHHARTVLRARAGDPCEIVFTGSGSLAHAVFEQVAPSVTVRVTTWVASDRPARVRLLLVQALPQPKKVDEIVEKGTEVGIDAFLIVPVSGSPRVPPERLGARAERWGAIAREAAKQSKQTAIPDVRVAYSFEKALEEVRAEGWRSVFLTPTAPRHLGEVLAAGGPSAAGPERWALWMGPESGWSERESEALVKAGCGAATLGGRVLRTETAGPVAGALARYALSDW